MPSPVGVPETPDPVAERLERVSLGFELRALTFNGTQDRIWRWQNVILENTEVLMG